MIHLNSLQKFGYIFEKCVETKLRKKLKTPDQSGFYIASADKSGKVRIWDTVNKEHILKYEYQPFAGEIRDLAWDGESKRIVVCGEGRQNFAAAFLWDSGSKCGNFTGLSKVVTSCDIKGRGFLHLCISY